jgi:hypothetical protein
VLHGQSWESLLERGERRKGRGRDGHGWGGGGLTAPLEPHQSRALIGGASRSWLCPPPITQHHIKEGMQTNVCPCQTVPPQTLAPDQSWWALKRGEEPTAPSPSPYSATVILHRPAVSTPTAGVGHVFIVYTRSR